MTDPIETRAALERNRASASLLLNSLTRDFSGIVEASADSNADDEHDPEGSTIAFERSQLSTLINQTRTRMAAIDAALSRLVDGTYGVCEVCGSSIPDERLEARPAARTCVGCA